jgi:hypothetical protein
LALLIITSGRTWIGILVAGVFVAELASVALQVAWFKISGERLFRCAPLHHHFQFAGWEERKIVRRFWLASAACAVVGGLSASFVATSTAISRPDPSPINAIDNPISAASLRMTYEANSASTANFSSF